VSVAGDVARVLAEIRRDMPPLRGVIHAAVVLEDGPVVEVDHASLQTVLAPKVAGAWNLHKLTLKDGLDFFVLFSSGSALLGIPLQGAYAAANSFLDALAYYRRGLGLPATAIGWGTLSGTGIIKRREDVGRYLSHLGVGEFTPAEALAVFEQILELDTPHVMGSRLAWDKVFASLPAGGAPKPLPGFRPAPPAVSVAPAPACG